MIDSSIVLFLGCSRSGSMTCFRDSIEQVSEKTLFCLYDFVCSNWFGSCFFVQNINFFGFVED